MRREQNEWMNLFFIVQFLSNSILKIFVIVLRKMLILWDTSVCLRIFYLLLKTKSLLWENNSSDSKHSETGIERDWREWTKTGAGELHPAKSQCHIISEGMKLVRSFVRKEGVKIEERMNPFSRILWPLFPLEYQTFFFFCRSSRDTHCETHLNDSKECLLQSCEFTRCSSEETQKQNSFSSLFTPEVIDAEMEVNCAKGSSRETSTQLSF